ncbi:polyprenyl synthetase family protein [Bdellovibrio sp. SKB1291214]|uniref:polyprenyl synthetase family protein n=1 Tax=Bdellovibrio sp. SKB1291214 TaxID=1732569 RepID=UPI000B516893|nr:polyprenyl synthetase family protein [Bdellovibrio sp. SKB1291214]UYL07848.1 polyprenyl synthetase family protein [Bdellovibrio sp. SKB1291214]
MQYMQEKIFLDKLDAVSQVWKDSLFGPVEEFLARPRKDFRSDLVRIGFGLHQREPATMEQSMSLNIICDVLEWIHSGSLIIDDIQDDSVQRRGSATIHRLYGMPKALNAGNWMYFKALESIHRLPITMECQLRLLQCAHNVMAKAHQGQALDLGVDLMTANKDDIPHLVESSHLMKSGALVALALQLGALIANPSVDLSRLDHLGAELGASLQRFDDLGNLRFQSEDPKSLEDFKLRRPSWLWSIVAESSDELIWQKFKMAVTALPDESALFNFFEETNFKSKALLKALDLHSRLTLDFEKYETDRFNPSALKELLKLTEKISHAY